MMDDDGCIYSPNRIGIDTVHPNPANTRRHGERDLAALKLSLSRFGQRKPIVVQQEGMVIRAGNGLWQAAKELGWKEILATVIPESSVEAVAYEIMDNRSAELSEWDDAALAAQLNAIRQDGVDLELTGFDESELDELLESLQPTEVAEDEAPEPQEEAVTRPGDLWICGEHRVLCGDATEAKSVAQLLNGETPFLCVTDPPYGVEYDPEWRNRAAAEGKLAYAARRVSRVPNDDRADWQAAWELFPGDVLYSWHPAGATSLVHAAAIQRAGFELRMQIIWAKSNFPIGRGDYHVRHEPCWYAVRKGAAARRTNDRTQTTLWEINLDRNVEGGHSTQKPVECMARPIRNHETSDAYDPFLGSGTTMIAAEQLNRRCYGIEIEPRYVDVSVRRWMNLTGKDAIRESDGAPFSVVAGGDG